MFGLSVCLHYSGEGGQKVVELVADGSVWRGRLRVVADEGRVKKSRESGRADQMDSG